MQEIVLQKEIIKPLLPERGKDTNKGSFGNILNIAGSINYRGAAFLSTISALKTGAGYITLCSIKEVLNSVSTLCPEAVLYPLEKLDGTIAQDEYKKITELEKKYKVLTLGCGISSISENQNNVENFVKNLLENINGRQNATIIDADGLNIISKLKTVDLPQNTILTPHPMELSRLLDININEIQKDRIKYAIEAAKKYKATVILKGYKTVITDGEKVFINSTGNSALSKAGTGDVLTGIISGLCAQNLNCLDASILGVYLHGLAGEIASKDLSEYSVNASDLINYIPKAIKTLLKENN